jgi:hypothetical protein
LRRACTDCLPTREASNELEISPACVETRDIDIARSQICQLPSHHVSALACCGPQLAAALNWNGNEKESTWGNDLLVKVSVDWRHEVFAKAINFCPLADVRLDNCHAPADHWSKISQVQIGTKL